MEADDYGAQATEQRRQEAAEIEAALSKASADQLVTALCLWHAWGWEGLGLRPKWTRYDMR